MSGGDSSFLSSSMILNFSDHDHHLIWWLTLPAFFNCQPPGHSSRAPLVSFQRLSALSVTAVEKRNGSITAHPLQVSECLSCRHSAVKLKVRQNGACYMEADQDVPVSSLLATGFITRGGGSGHTSFIVLLSPAKRLSRSLALKFDLGSVLPDYV